MFFASIIHKSNVLYLSLRWDIYWAIKVTIVAQVHRKQSLSLIVLLEEKQSEWAHWTWHIQASMQAKHAGKERNKIRATAHQAIEASMGTKYQGMASHLCLSAFSEQSHAVDSLFDKVACMNSLWLATNLNQPLSQCWCILSCWECFSFC